MKKFTKIVETLEAGKFYKSNIVIELILSAENEGEAGYKSDYILSSIDNISSYEIINIDETDDRIIENAAPFKKDNRTPEEIIESSWDEKFNGRDTSTDEKMEFYHDMRKVGFDGKLVFNALKDKFGF